MKVSIIILNTLGSDNLERLIDSIIVQNYKDFEIIVIDFENKDINPTLSKYQTYIQGVIPVFDGLMFDSLNIAIDLTTGDLISILSSDDYFKNMNAFGQIVDIFECSNLEICYGSLIPIKSFLIKRNLKQIIDFKTIEKSVFLNINHFIFRSELFVKYGKFNLGLPTSAFYELILRFVSKYNLPIQTCKQEILVNSNPLIFKKPISIKELELCWKINKLKMPFIMKLTCKLRKYNIL